MIFIVALCDRFAASASVVGDDEVQVTGDVTMDIVDYLTKKFSEVCVIPEIQEKLGVFW